MSWIAYTWTKPFYTAATFDCGNGRTVQIVRPNVFCDNAEKVHFTYDGIKFQPPSFGFWPCGGGPLLAQRCVDGGNVVVIVDADSQTEAYIIVDFKTGWCWPTSRDRKVDPKTLDMVSRIRGEVGELWLWDTYDGQLKRPGG